MTQEIKDKTPVQRLLVPKYILTTARILTKISPHIASRFAARLFLTPFRYKLPEREREMHENSRKKKLKVPGIDREIMIYEFGDSPRKILLVHGWSGRGTQLAVLARELVNSGWGVISFDAPAHGDAPGRLSMMPFFVSSMHYLEKMYGPFEAAVAHSLGGMASLRAVSEGLDLQRLVIIGTANSITRITKEFAVNMQMSARVAELMKAYLDRKFGEDMDNYSGAVSAQKVKVPTLVIHDLHDVDVHIQSAHDIAGKLEKGTLYTTEGLGHRRILGNRKVINKIIEFLSA